MLTDQLVVKVAIFLASAGGIETTSWLLGSQVGVGDARTEPSSSARASSTRGTTPSLNDLVKLVILARHV